VVWVPKNTIPLPITVWRFQTEFPDARSGKWVDMGKVRMNRIQHPSRPVVPNGYPMCPFAVGRFGYPNYPFYVPVVWVPIDTVPLPIIERLEVPNEVPKLTAAGNG